MNNTLESIKNRYSCRGYKEEQIGDEELEAIIQAGLQAPTATNRKEIHFTVLSGKSDIVKELDADFKASRNIAPTAKSFYYGAPTVVMISSETGFFWNQIDAGIAVENMSIAAESLGIGSLIIGCVKDLLLGEKKAYYAEKFQFPEGYDFAICLALGYKDASKAPHDYDKEEQVSYI